MDFGYIADKLIIWDVNFELIIFKKEKQICMKDKRKCFLFIQFPTDLFVAHKKVQP